MPDHSANVCCIAYDQGIDQQLFAGLDNGQVYIWDTIKYQNKVLTGHKGQITSIAHESAQNLIATSSVDGLVKIWDTRASNNNATFTFGQHKDAVRGVAISPDGRWIASGGYEGIVKIWELDTGKMIKELVLNQSDINHQVGCLEYNPSTLTLAYGSTDKTVKYWDLENFQNICKTAEDTSEIVHLSFYEENPDLLFAASNDHIRLWNVETNK